MRRPKCGTPLNVHSSNTSGTYVPKICSPGWLGITDGMGGIVVLSVRSVQIKLNGIVPGMPKGTMVTHSAKPSGDKHGIAETILPPKGRNGASAKAGRGAKNMRATAILPKFLIFSLYTGYHMSVRTYLPSAQFLVIASALAVSGGVVAAAQYFTASHNAQATLSSAGAGAASGAWKQSLADIQAQSGVDLPDAPNEGTIETLLDQAQSTNLTDSIGRQLLVKLTAAGVQGLGSDIPTQDSIIAEAAAQINSSPADHAPVELILVDANEETLRAYGNAVMATVAGHPKASINDTLRIVAAATDTKDAAKLEGLASIGREYKAIATELAAIPVPKTLSPLHGQVVQDLGIIADTYPQMQKIVDDPLRGLAALQKYQSLMSEEGRVFINIAEALNKGGILFSKDEPGSAWSVFLAP